MKTWEWDNLLLFPGNDTHKSSTGECKVKEVRATTLMKHDTGGGGSPSSRENRMLAAPPPPPHVEKQRKQSGLVTVAVPALSGDSVIGLKLGKRTYFEAVKAIPAAAPKKQRSGMQGTQVAKCQVEECKIELSGAKDYHRRHKVCEMHSKSAKVTVAGIEQRFCQQCTRFHVLSEFDEGKRSCRRRLAGHNERRRKPQPDSFTINPARFPSNFYGTVEKTKIGQMHFVIQFICTFA